MKIINRWNPLKTIWMLLSLFCLLLTAGCAENGEGSTDTSIDNSEMKFQVVTSFYPIYVLTANITSKVESISLSNMSPPQTGCLHDYEITTGDMRLISATDLFIINGGGMESFLTNVQERYNSLAVVDTSEGVELIPSALAHEHSHEDGYVQENETNDEHLEEYNSHIWLSPANAEIQVKNITAGLSKMDPANISLYENNANNFIKKLDELQQLQNSFPYQGEKIAIFHEGFDYIAKNYGLTIVCGAALDENQQPSPKALVEMIEDIQRENVSVLLAGDEPGYRLAELIAKETGAKVVLLDPITSGEMTADSYISAMTSNDKLLREAFQ